MAEKSNFLYYDHADEIPDDFDFVVSIDPDFDDRKEFLASLAEALMFPTPFKKSWDALNELLNDLSWIEGERVLLIHEDIPLEGVPGEAAEYLEILIAARQGWSDQGTMDLTLAFPAKCRSRIAELVGYQAY